jgi:hypothetical protein
MSSSRLPMLMEDGSSLDWGDAGYSVEVKLLGRRAVVEHRLSDAVELQRLIDDGRAEWVTELRCPRTLLSRQFSGQSPRQEVTWRDDEIIGDVYLIPGLVARAEARVVSPVSLDPVVWPGPPALDFPEGCWLAKGDVRSITPLLASLVRFKRDSEGRLSNGRMSVEEASDGQAPYFRVTLACDLHDRRLQDRDVQIAGLVAAFGLLPLGSLRAEGENCESHVANRLRDELEACDVADWDSDDFDPALAATAMEPFFVSADQQDSDDD